MKKITSFFIVAVMMLFSLTSCVSGGVGDFQYPYKPPVVKEISLNLYIICEDDCDTVALKTVADDVADYTDANFGTKVNVIYKKASDYLESVRAGVAANAGLDKAGIVLINSKALFDELYAANKLLDLTAAYKTNAFGRLNSNINSSLLEASYLTVTPDDPATEDNEEVKKIFTVPNNRVLGEYTYLVIDKQAANDKFISKQKAESFTTVDEAVLAGIPADKVELVTGPYEKRFDYTDGYYCNIVEYPTVTAEDAFESAFAVISGGAIPKKASVSLTDEEFTTRAMQIIYAINTDKTLRNLLQYGREGTNYTVANGKYTAEGVVGNGEYDRFYDSSVPAGKMLLPDGRTVDHNDADDADRGFVIVANGTIVSKTGANDYKMNVIYTGDVFKATYSYYTGIGHVWNADMASNGANQNKDVSFAR